MTHKRNSVKTILQYIEKCLNFHLLKSCYKVLFRQGPKRNSFFIQKGILATFEETSEITEYLMNLNFITAKIISHINQKQHIINIIKHINILYCTIFVNMLI